LAIAWLEDVQRQRHTRKENQRQREEREPAVRGHPWNL
jgi:hypothetical protein